ncbi:MAG: IS4 family transposase, partial [Planctomycetaceae bacterium]|nr:IS4 family transposase [Planctomycetaceae bacterium]
MAARRAKRTEIDPLILQGAGILRRVFPLLAVLAESGTARDKAGNRRLRFSQYAALVLVGLFNPVLQS